MTSKPYKVAVLMGSPNDASKMQPATDTLAKFGLEPDMQAISAHRNPDEVAEFVRSARDRGYVALICAAGAAAHLTLPVVGVPISGGGLNGVDALYSTVQMPPGIPVATVAIDGAVNAALLVIQMLAITDADLEKQLVEDRRERAEAKRWKA